MAAVFMPGAAGSGRRVSTAPNANKHEKTANDGSKDGRRRASMTSISRKAGVVQSLVKQLALRWRSGRRESIVAGGELVGLGESPALLRPARRPYDPRANG